MADEMNQYESTQSGSVEATLAERESRALAQRSALLRAVEETRLARSLTFSDDEHDPDGSLASLDQARDVALLHKVEQTLAELDEARHRLAIGTYGRCERCDGPIGELRLEARPETRWCVACAAGRKSRSSD